jgi:hypothetical protein
VSIHENAQPRKQDNAPTAVCTFSHEKRRVARLRDGDRLAGHIEVEPAEDCSRQAMALAEALGMRPLLGHRKLGLGALHTKIGRREPAQAELTTAMALFHALEVTFWLPEAEATLAQMEG